MTARRPGRRVGRWSGTGLAVLLTTAALVAPAAGLAVDPAGVATTAARATVSVPRGTEATTPAAPVPAPPGAEVAVEVTRVDPQVLRPGEDLTVTVRVENARTTPVEQPRVLLHLDRRSFISRSSLDRWRDAGVDDPVGATVATVDLDTPLAPGASTTVTVTVPAGSVGLRRGYSSWGPRGVAVETVDRADPARARLGLARTFMLWFPVEDVTPTRVSTLVPLVGPAVDPFDRAWVADLEDLTAEEGRLGRVLAATEDHPKVTWVLDPWLAEVTHSDDEPGTSSSEDADAADEATSGNGSTDEDQGPAEGTGSDDGSGAGDGSDDDPATEPDDEPAAAEVPLERTAYGTLTGQTAAEGARAWAERLISATVRRDVELLPYLDPDLAALAHARDPDRLTRARARAAEVVSGTRLPDGARTSIAWPADPLPDLATAALATSHGERAVVLGPGELPPSAALTYTPSGRTTVLTDAGEVVVLIPDARLSAALREGSPLAGTGGPTPVAGPAEATTDAAPAPTPAAAAQDLLAELAVITRERPSDSRHLLLTVPRDWDPDPAVVDAQLTALDEAPWVQQESVSALVGAPDTGVDRGTLPTRSVAPDELGPTRLGTVTDTVAERLRVARMGADPGALVGDTALEVLAPVSTAWRADPDGREALVDRSVAATAALRASVEVLESSTVNLLATSGGVPVRIGNTLAQDVTVAVALRPGDARLRADEPVPVTIPAGGEELVRVPVHAIQSADLQVRVVVSTPDGQVVSDDAVLLVRVRAEWEGIGSAVIAGLLAIGTVLGVIRAIRRGRATGRRAGPVTDHGPDALSPEAAAARTAGSSTDTETDTHDQAGSAGEHSTATAGDRRPGT